MDTILTGTINEIYKILSKKKFVLLMGASVIITIAAAVINMLSFNNLGIFVINNQSLPVVVLNLLASLLLPLFIIMITSDLFSGEISDNSIVMSLVRPISRNKLYISKILSIGFITFAFLLSTFIVAFAVSLLSGNFGEIISKMPSNLLSYVTAVIPMLLIAIIAAFIAQFTKSGGMTVVLLILLSILMSSASIFLPQIVSFLPTTYLTWYQNFYSGVNFSIVLNEFLYILAYGIIFMFAGTYLFQKKDI